MTTQKQRTHVVLPADLVAEIDALVGTRGRSRFIAQASQERLQRERMLRALEAGFALWKDADHPELQGPEGTVGWVSRIRAADQQQREERLRE